MKINLIQKVFAGHAWISWLWLCGKVKGFILPVTSTFPHTHWSDDTQRKEATKAEREREIHPWFAVWKLNCVLCAFNSEGDFFPTHSPHSCWRTSQMSWGPTSPCTWIKSCWNCRSLNRPAGGVCAPSPLSSRPPFRLLGSSSSARATPSKLSTLCVQAQWKYWRTTLFWPFWVKSSTDVLNNYYCPWKSLAQK